MNKQILIVGLASPLGTKIDNFLNKLTPFIEDRYGAQTHKISLSELMKLNFSSELTSAEFLGKSRLLKLKRKIELGNQLRQDYQLQDIFAQFAALKINDVYKKIVGSTKNKHVIIVDQFKRPEEIKYMERVFGSSFWLIGLDSPLETRLENLTDADSDLLVEAKKLVYVDENEDANDFGQRMRKAFLLSHVVFSDSFDQDEAQRFFDLLNSSHIELPSPEEYFMNMAFSASLKTGDLSRQVGAVIVSSELNQISCGANEVNKFGGGSYWPPHNKETDLHRKFDPNKKVIQEIKQQLKERITQGGLSEDDAMALLEKSKLDDLTEFHRTTHAEMDAILSAQRNGMRIVGSTIYCTTFPCHNCAKHIVSSGISRVVFHEPYPKSLAFTLHDDSLSKIPAKDKVLLQEFKGITHMRFNELFSMSYSTGQELKRKKDDVVQPFDPKAAPFRFSLWVSGFSKLASLALDTFNEDGSMRINKVAG